jgi:hypothetical protein
MKPKAAENSNQILRLSLGVGGYKSSINKGNRMSTRYAPIQDAPITTGFFINRLLILIRTPYQISGAISLNRIELMIAKASEPSKALQKPYLKRNPGTKAADIPKIIEFRTKKNKLKVRIINGKVNKVKAGSKSAFRMPKTAAVINALPKLSISTPIGSLEIIKKLMAVTNQVIINPTIRRTPD